MLFNFLNLKTIWGVKMDNQNLYANFEYSAKRLNNLIGAFQEKCHDLSMTYPQKEGDEAWFHQKRLEGDLENIIPGIMDSMGELLPLLHKLQIRLISR